MTRRIIVTVAASLQADVARRQLSGTLVRYGELGHTSAGPLRVRPGAIVLPDDITAVPLVRDHEATAIRGHLGAVDDNDERMHVALPVADGPEGDAALAEADRMNGDKVETVRAGLSYYLDPVELDDEGWISKGVLQHIGQVEEPAHNSSRIDSIAASKTPGASRTNTGGSMTPEEIARLAELRNNANRTPEEEAELQALITKALDSIEAPTASAADPEEPADPQEPPADPNADPEEPAARVAASVPSVPGGQPLNTTSRTATRTQPKSPFQRMLDQLATAFQSRRTSGNVLAGVTAALSDITSTAHTDNIEAKGWQGELFDGVDFTPVWSDLLTPGSLTNWEGQGWRVTSVPAMQDYAGDKAEIQSGTVTTEKELWEAAREAVGMDIDRKFFDFPNADFLNKVFKEVGLTWLEILDSKAKAFMLTEAVKATKSVTISTTSTDATITFAAGMITAADVGASITGAGIPNGTTVLSWTDATHAELSANATATAAGITATIDVQADSVLKAAGRVALSLNRKGTGFKAPSNTGADYILLNDEDMFTLMDIDADSVPAFLNLFKIDPNNFRADPSVPRGTVLGGVKKAAQLLTPPNQPLEVDALNLALGGVDKAFFGYWAILQNHTRGIQKTKFVPAA